MKDRKTQLFLGLVIALFTASCLTADDGNVTLDAEPHTSNKVLLIGVDGLHIEVMARVPTPQLDELVETGVQRIGFNTWESDERPSSGHSTPNWASILTGVAPHQHDLLTNGALGRPHKIDDDGTNPTPADGERISTIFGAIKSQNADLKTAVVHTWGGIGVREAGILEYCTTSVDYSFCAPEPPDNRDRDRLNAMKVVDLLSGQTDDVTWDPDLTFIHLGQTDTHARVFDAEGELTPNATQRMSNVDELVGLMVDAIRERPTYEHEDWLIAVVADHGTDDYGNHADNGDPRIRTVPYILNGRTVCEESLPETPHSWDVAPLVVEYLCCPSLRRISLIADPDFERGFTTWSPEPGKKVRTGRLTWNDDETDEDADPPAWGLAQWHSRFDLGKTHVSQFHLGEQEMLDGAKGVVRCIHLTDDIPPVFVFHLNGFVEYEQTSPDKGAAWPHLLAEQRFVENPRIDQLESVPFHIQYRLLRSDPYKDEGWSDQRHTAQFLFYLTVQNLNPDSPGQGDYLWFGVPMYDARYGTPTAHMAPDVGTEMKGGTGKFIYNPSGETYTDQSVVDGEWITIEKNLLPLIREALAMAWDRGYLQDSQDESDYGLGGMNIGWEVTGTLDVEMAFSELRVEAELR
jgi:hypothetical protein